MKYSVVVTTAEPDAEIVEVRGPFWTLAEADAWAAEHNKPEEDRYTEVSVLVSP